MAGLQPSASARSTVSVIIPNHIMNCSSTHALNLALASAELIRLSGIVVGSGAAVAVDAGAGAGVAVGAGVGTGVGSGGGSAGSEAHATPKESTNASRRSGRNFMQR